MNDTPDEWYPRTPHDATRVARRAAVLAAVGCRGSIDNGVGEPEADAVRTRMLEWLTAMNLWDEVEPRESELLLAPLGTLGQKDVNQAMGSIEGVAILAWALQEYNLPLHDQEVDPYAVAEAAWLFSEYAAESIGTAILRTSIELEACREVLYAIHVRLRDFIRHRKAKDISDWFEQIWLDALGLDRATLIVDNDLTIDGKPISVADESRIHECSSLLFERHRAIIWLFDGYPVYSQTPVDT
jgi:hypothetical protein